jgi:hemerythrin-like domain-containing protein
MEFSTETVQPKKGGMMTPTKILMDEHALIRQFLDNLVMSLEKMETGERPPVKFFEKAAEFSDNFVNKYHHFKEEHLMFGLLAQKRKGDIDAQVESLRHQHERGRDHISEVRTSLDGYAKCSDEHCEDIYSTTILENIAAYIHLLRHHIHREDHIFYPAVDIELTDEEQQYLLDEFGKEDSKAGGEFLERMKKTVIEMGSLLSS